MSDSVIIVLSIFLISLVALGFECSRIACECSVWSAELRALDCIEKQRRQFAAIEPV